VVETAVRAAGIRPRLVAVWLLLGALVGVIVVIEHTRSERLSNADPRMLLPVPVDQLGAIEVVDAGTLHRFERDGAGVWFYHGLHTGAEGTHTHNADQVLAERIERALAAFGRTRIERHFALDRVGIDYGVAMPGILVLVYRPNQSRPLVQYAVGDIAPDTVSRYVTVVGSPVVVTIPNYQIANLLGLIQAVAGHSDQGLTRPARAR
jgi:hypothetical protein